MSELIQDGIFFVKCDKKMKLGGLTKYEYEEGFPLHNVQAYVCPKCNKVFFTEDQSHEMDTRTKELKEYAFGFERKITISGKSLVVTIPSEIAEHLKFKKGQKVKIIPIAREGMMIRKN